MHDQPSFRRTPSETRKSYFTNPNDFTLIPHDFINDRSISPKAKGILFYLVHLPDDGVIYRKQLQEALNIGEEYLNSGLQELLKAGYQAILEKKGLQIKNIHIK